MPTRRSESALDGLTPEDLMVLDRMRGTTVSELERILEIESTLGMNDDDDDTAPCSEEEVEDDNDKAAQEQDEMEKEEDKADTATSNPSKEEHSDINRATESGKLSEEILKGLLKHMVDDDFLNASHNYINNKDLIDKDPEQKQEILRCFNGVASEAAVRAMAAVGDRHFPGLVDDFNINAELIQILLKENNNN